MKPLPSRKQILYYLERRLNSKRTRFDMQFFCKIGEDNYEPMAKALTKPACDTIRCVMGHLAGILIEHKLVTATVLAQEISRSNNDYAWFWAVNKFIDFPQPEYLKELFSAQTTQVSRLFWDEHSQSEITSKMAANLIRYIRIKNAVPDNYRSIVKELV